MHPPIPREVGPPGATSTRYESCRCADCVAELKVDARAMTGLLSKFTSSIVFRHTTYTDGLGREVCHTCGASEIHQPMPHKDDCPVVLAEKYIEKYRLDSLGRSGGKE